MRALMLALAILACAVASTSRAHGPQIQITRDNNQITTRRLLREEPYSSRLTRPTSVYVIPLLETQGVWYARPNNSASQTLPGLPEYLSGPGIAYGYDQADGGARAFASGQHFELQLIDGLRQWNGASFVDPGLEEIEAFRTSGASATTDDSLTAAAPAVLSFSSVSATYNSGAHSGALFRLIEAPPNALAPSDDGVYLLSMSYASTEPGLTQSAPFFFLLHKNALQQEIQSAVSALGFAASSVQYVPEPSAMAIGALTTVLLVLPYRSARSRRPPA